MKRSLIERARGLASGTVSYVKGKAFVVGGVVKRALPVVVTVGAVAVGMSGGVAMADDPAPLNLSSFSEVINFITIRDAAWTVGGAGLLAAFTVGGGFRIAKKVFSWIMNKM